MVLNSRFRKIPILAILKMWTKSTMILSDSPSRSQPTSTVRGSLDRAKTGTPLSQYVEETSQYPGLASSTCFCGSEMTAWHVSPIPELSQLSRADWFIKHSTTIWSNVINGTGCLLIVDTVSQCCLGLFWTQIPPASASQEKKLHVWTITLNSFFFLWCCW